MVRRGGREGREEEKGGRKRRKGGREGREEEQICIILHNSLIHSLSLSLFRSVKNPRTGCLLALKRIPRVFHSLLSCVRTFREIKMLCELKHDNVS